MFERRRLAESCASPVPAPKLIEVGATASVERTAALRSSKPAPASCTCWDSPGGEKAGAALLISSERYWRAVNPGRPPSGTAAAPAITGVEKLVPATLVTYPLAL